MKKLLLLIALSLGILTGSFEGLKAEAESNFTDVKTGYWAESDIEYLSNQKIISGFPDGSFRPSTSITRLQTAIMFVRAMGWDTSNRPNPGFLDVQKADYGYEIIAAVADEGLFSGSNGKFRANDPLTRAEMAALLVRAYQLSGNFEKGFKDVSNNYWAYDAIQSLAGEGITKGYPDNTFRPKASTTRAEFAVFMTRVMKKQNDPNVTELTITAKESILNVSKYYSTPVWTYGGTTPGTEIRVQEGNTLRVHLKNELPEPTTIHWHGIPLPNPMDGVPGVTQNAVQPGQSFTYEFKVNHPGTYLYHSHQQSAIQVDKGLFGALIVEEKNKSYDRDHVVIFDRFGISGKIGSYIPTLKVKNGERIRVRFINIGRSTYGIYVNDTDYKVTHTDGQPINEPGILNNHIVPIGPGERYDIEFTADSRKNTYISRTFNGSISSATTVFLEYEGVNKTTAPNVEDLPSTVSEVDMTRYGKTKSSNYDQTTPYNVEYTMELGSKNHDTEYTINDKVYPHDFDPVKVEEGDKVKVTISNPSNEDHPMHLHGHFFEILSKNGQLIEGSPLIKDTVNVKPNETYEIAFTADNPGHWMFHCHKLNHAAAGMVTKVLYNGYEPTFIPDENAGNIAD
jgi:FtsP/CotA-like multicopper oxidase with cupredoxin domain